MERFTKRELDIMRRAVDVYRHDVKHYAAAGGEMAISLRELDAIRAKIDAGCRE